MYKERIISIFLMLLVCLLAVASGTRHMTLDEAIMLARLRSVDASVALNELRTSYWQYRTYRADMLPEISFQGTLPTIPKTIPHISWKTEATRSYATTTLASTASCPLTRTSRLRVVGCR